MPQTSSAAAHAPFTTSSPLRPGINAHTSYPSVIGYAGDDDDNEDEEADIVYDDDEDEFGLPSISSMRRKPAKSTDSFRSKGVNLGSGGRHSGGGNGALEPGGNGTSLGSGPGTGRDRANSSDIAEERGAQMYPVARKGEGKILRPQYKEILRGKSVENGWSVKESANMNGFRSCQFSEPHQS